MIKVREVGNETEYIAQGGNGLGITGLVTGVTAATLTLAGWAKEFLSNRNGNNGNNCNMAQAVPALCAAVAPVLQQALGTPVTANTVLSEQAMRIATLEAEKYTDAQIAKLYEYNRGNEKELWELKAEVQCLKEKLTDYALNEREKDVLRSEIIDGKISKVQDNVICLAGKVDDGFKTTNAGFVAVNARINDITTVYIPQSVICNDKKNCCNRPQQ